jgi:ketosteroid isomerase-like protein
MIKTLRAAGVWCALAIAAAAAPALAQNLALRAPGWAQPLTATDVTPTTGGRAILVADGVNVSVRVTIMPAQGGVARVIRFDQRDDGGHLFVRRFTGHPSTGWWLWGSDGPRVTAVGAAQSAEIAALARASMGITGALGGGQVGDVCPAGEQVFVEVAVEGRSSGMTRNCASASDAAGRLALRLSDIAGSRTEEEFHQAALNELLSADRAFAAKARADGVPAAFAAYADDNAIMLSRQAVTQGHDAIVSRFANWPAGQHIEWAPEAGRVSERGDMGWTWGNATYIAADGTRTTGRYISIWTRDLDGNWRYAVDAGVN